MEREPPDGPGPVGDSGPGTGSAARIGPEAYRVLYEHCPDGVLFTVPDGRVLAANPAACSILQMSEEEICRLGRPGLADPDDQRWGELLGVRQRTGHVLGIARMRRADGTFIEVEMNASIFRTADGEDRTCTTIRDVSDRVALEEERRALSARLGEIALTDHLTGLRNRRGVATLGTQLLELADRQGADVQVLFADVDDMKALNDTLGHSAGDAGLQVVARALGATFRKSDVVARIGGDEFLVLSMGLHESDRAAAETRLRRALADPQDIASVGRRMEVSLGWVTRPAGDRSSLDDLMAGADQVMYESRTARRAARQAP